MWRGAVNAPPVPLLFISLADKHYTICANFCNLLSQHQPAVGGTELQPVWLSVCGHVCVCCVLLFIWTFTKPIGWWSSRCVCFLCVLLCACGPRDVFLSVWKLSQWCSSVVIQSDWLNMSGGLTVVSVYIGAWVSGGVDLVLWFANIGRDL